MKEFQHGTFLIHTSADMARLHQSSFDESWSERHKEHLVHMFTKRTLFRKILEVWQNASGLNGSVVLEAHGNFHGGQWVYYENGQIVDTVQGWVDKMDGKVGALMITSCNPRASEVISQRSLVMYTRELAGSFPAMVHTPGLIRLYVPGEGYLERDYKKLRRVIGKLTSRG